MEWVKARHAIIKAASYPLSKRKKSTLSHIHFSNKNFYSEMNRFEIHETVRILSSLEKNSVGAKMK